MAAICRRFLGVNPLDKTENFIKVKCPYCGYEMPIKYTQKAAVCFGVFVRCKGRQCKREFEIKIDVR